MAHNRQKIERILSHPHPFSVSFFLGRTYYRASHPPRCNRLQPVRNTSWQPMWLHHTTHTHSLSSPLLPCFGSNHQMENGTAKATITTNPFLTFLAMQHQPAESAILSYPIVDKHMGNKEPDKQVSLIYLEFQY